MGRRAHQDLDSGERRVKTNPELISAPKPNPILPHSTDLPHFTTMAEIEASAFFPDENVNWKYCVEHATFAHRDACEFIIHAGETDYVHNKAEQMKNFGCTPAFIDAYLLAAASGAIRVLFYV